MPLRVFFAGSKIIIEPKALSIGRKLPLTTPVSRGSAGQAFVGRISILQPMVGTPWRM